MTWFHFPIADVSTPCDRFEAAWAAKSEGIRSILRSGFDVLVHCKGGLGRAGMIAARLLVELGWEADEAITEVRRVRRGAIETPEQVAHVRRQSPRSEPHHDDDERAVEDRALGALMGLAVGDALGTTLEFEPRDNHPRITDLVGGGPFNLAPGNWTDDTSMALALADSLIAHGTLDEHDLMKRFVRWWRNGDYSCTGRCFDIGGTTSQALSRFEHGGDPIAGSSHPHSAGNGSLMRLAPVVLHGFTIAELGAVEVSERQSRTTHAAPACLDACREFAFRLYLAAAGKNQSFVLGFEGSATDPDVARVLAGSWRGKRRNQIRSSGYVVDSLEAALWCVARTTTFEDAVILAANLADDADTTAAITGQLAGAIYGLSAIPERWLTQLAWRDKIEQAGRALLRGVPQSPVFHP
jgi:ADP-ribosyl-[dinitrogen reductase] hydrolase